MTDLFSELTGQLNRKFEGYDAEIAVVQGRLRVEMSAHFTYDNSELREEDKPALDESTEVIRHHHSNVIITAHRAPGEPTVLLTGAWRWSSITLAVPDSAAAEGRFRSLLPPDRAAGRR
jgi:hypothetical protein